MDAHMHGSGVAFALLAKRQACQAEHDMKHGIKWPIQLLELSLKLLLHIKSLQMLSHGDTIPVVRVGHARHVTNCWVQAK